MTQVILYPFVSKRAPGRYEGLVRVSEKTQIAMPEEAAGTAIGYSYTGYVVHLVFHATQSGARKALQMGLPGYVADLYPDAQVEPIRFV